MYVRVCAYARVRASVDFVVVELIVLTFAPVPGRPTSEMLGSV